jgi:hypothetical protein
LLKSAVVINLKKAPSNQQSKTKEIKTFAERDKDFLKEQNTYLQTTYCNLWRHRRYLNRVRIVPNRLNSWTGFIPQIRKKITEESLSKIRVTARERSLPPPTPPPP